MALPSAGRAAAGKPLAAVLRARANRRELRPPRDYDTEEERRTQAFFMSPNNFVVGGVRFNLHGREREGRVRPGSELHQLCEQLERDLLALVNADTGTSVIERVTRSDSVYGREQHDALPDLFLEWNHDHPIEKVWSPRFGLISGPYAHWRTGDHRPGGLLLMQGPAVAPGAALPAIQIGQLGALIAAELGVELDADRPSESEHVGGTSP